MSKQPEIKDFINGEVFYDREGQMFFINDKNDSLKMVGSLRGWGHIHKMPAFRNKDMSIDFELAAKFQDEIGEFIASAINENNQMSKTEEIKLMLSDYTGSLPSDEELDIAVFMDLKPLIINEFHKIVGWYKDDPKNWFSFPEYKTWNDLMPVVEKIETLYSENFPADFVQKVLAKENDIIDHQYMDVIALPLASKIDEAYANVVTFIKWYNENKQQ